MLELLFLSGVADGSLDGSSDESITWSPLSVQKMSTSSPPVSNGGEQHYERIRKLQDELIEIQV